MDIRPNKVVWAGQRCGNAEERRDAALEPEALGFTSAKGGPTAGKHAIELLVAGVVEVLQVQLRGGAELYFGRGRENTVEARIGFAQLFVDGAEPIAALRLGDYGVGPVVAVRSIQVKTEHDELIGRADETKEEQRTGKPADAERYSGYAG